MLQCLVATHGIFVYNIYSREKMEEENGIYSRELFDPTDVNDFKNRRVLIDLQERTPSISICIAKEDAYIASLTGIIKTNRTKFLQIVPNKRVMKEILKHIFKLTGQLYEDIPIVFRQSHVTLALYLKHCLMSGSCSDTPCSRTRSYVHYDGLLKEKKENEVLRSIDCLQKYFGLLKSIEVDALCPSKKKWIKEVFHLERVCRMYTDYT